MKKRPAREKGEQREFREAGETGKNAPVLEEITAPDLVTVCRCYNVQKVPVSHDVEQLDYGCQGSPWSGQVGEGQT